MTTATATATEYKTFTWQAVRKLAGEIGVPFYSNSSYSISDGIGLKADRFSEDRIYVYGYERSYSDVNQFMSDRIQSLAKQNFMLKLELWALKNHVQFEIHERKHSYGTERYIKIVQA